MCMSRLQGQASNIWQRWKHLSQYFDASARSLSDRRRSTTGLLALPPEIVRTITEYLSPPERACLLLCNQYLLAVIGKDTLAGLQRGTDEEDGDRDVFLIILTRDLPHHFFCYECSRLHRQVCVGPLGPALQPHNPLPCVAYPHRQSFWGRLGAQGLKWCGLTFSHVQLAMKRYRYGPEHGISTDSLAFVSVSDQNDDQTAQRTTKLVSVDAHIFPEPETFCLRVQQWVMLRSTELRDILPVARSVEICHHLDDLTWHVRQAIESNMDSHWPEITLPIISDVSNCDWCCTDFQIELRMVGDDSLAMVITKWLDLGAGLSLKDIKWSSRPFRRHGKLIPERPGQVRMRFETQDFLSQDSLLSRNAEYLNSGNFRNVMDRWDNDAWILQAGKRLPLTERFKPNAGWWIVTGLILLTLFDFSIRLGDSSLHHYRAIEWLSAALKTTSVIVGPAMSIRFVAAFDFYTILEELYHLGYEVKVALLSRKSQPQ